jgi:DNA helicase IV
MDASEKKSLLVEAQRETAQIISAITQQIPVAEQVVHDTKVEMSRTHSSEAVSLIQNLLAIRQLQLAGLKEAYNSPYFVRCDVELDTDKTTKTLRFGKFSIPEFGIYSWTTPAARIRFNKPGSFSYTTNTRNEISGQMSRVDQYLIVQQEIRFMTTEMIGVPRTLIHQEKFSSHKTEFMLPEIVERMEKAQDDIIRTDAYGSFLISGPAGSGKTTLALHRIAYLLQAPEYADQFDPRKILVLVQDDSSKQYFEKLLPSLGITNVGISTFDLWAMDLLDLSTLSYTQHYGHSESERDLYAASKYQALKERASGHKKDPFDLLEKCYYTHFSDPQKELFATQRKAKVLDRFDLTLLLRAHLDTKGAFTKRQRVYSRTAKDTVKTSMQNVEVKYSLIVVDEVQNYLPEQIHALQSCISEETKAMTYVGDLAQQTSLFALRDWSHVGEEFTNGRAVHLSKVYRSTRQILEYIRSAGFEIDIPEGIREGVVVQESTLPLPDIFQKAKEILEHSGDAVVGIIGLQDEDIAHYAQFKTTRCKVMTAPEAQGLEFDIVIFIRNQDVTHQEYPENLRVEKTKVIRDQVYVALTRAMNVLHVFNVTPNTPL